MHAEFTPTVTGTPVENRLADLWCIMDTAQPGVLGDLMPFSPTYEPDETPPERLQGLNRKLDGCTKFQRVPMY